MQNPILQMLNQQTNTQTNMLGNIQQVKNLMNMVTSAKNPQAMLSNLAQNNPQMQEVMKLVQGSNGNAKQAFYALAQQKGVDPNQIINMLK